MTGFTILKESLKERESEDPAPLMSDNFTCHAFDKAGKLHLCTAAGEILICDHDGNL